MTKRGEKTAKRREMLFYILMIALPVLQFCIFYIGVNFNSILLAFQTYDREGNTFRFAGFENFVFQFREFALSSTLRGSVVNSLKVWFATTIVSLPCALLFSFFIYQKMPASGFFKAILFLPSIIPGMVTVIIYMYFVERALPVFCETLFGKEMDGLLQNPSTQFGAVFFYNAFLSFGGNMLLLLGGMNTVDVSVREAAQLDGASGFREFYHVVLPKVWATLTTFLVLGVAGIFSNQFGLYSFYGIAASERLATMGYLLYARTSIATLAEYPALACLGVLLTVVIVPVTLGVKAFLEKIGPKE